MFQAHQVSNQVIPNLKKINNLVSKMVSKSKNREKDISQK